MAKYCGGIKIDETMKMIDGVICDANASVVDVDKAVSVCGQLWDGNGDGELFLKIGVIAIEDVVVEFEVIEVHTDILKSIVRVIGIC